jgi:hypothetical protein
MRPNPFFVTITYYATFTVEKSGSKLYASLVNFSKGSQQAKIRPIWSPCDQRKKTL